MQTHHIAPRRYMPRASGALFFRNPTRTERSGGRMGTCIHTSTMRFGDALLHSAAARHIRAPSSQLGIFVPPRHSSAYSRPSRSSTYSRPLFAAQHISALSSQLSIFVPPLAARHIRAPSSQLGIFAPSLRSSAFSCPLVAARHFRAPSSQSDDIWVTPHA